MTEIVRLGRNGANMDFRFFVEATLAGLHQYYLKAFPEKDREAFFTEIFEKMASREDTSGDFYINEAYRLRDAGKPCNLKFASMLASCGYLVEASTAFRELDNEKAWSFMAEARYWCGITTASQNIDEAYRDTIIHTRKETGSFGGKAKSEKNLVVKNYAFELARLRRPKEKGWLSRAQAANRIYSEVMDFAKQQPNPSIFSKDKFPKTLASWLKEMPEASTLFPDKKKK